MLMGGIEPLPAATLAGATRLKTAAPALVTLKPPNKGALVPPVAVTSHSGALEEHPRYSDSSCDCVPAPSHYQIAGGNSAATEGHYRRTC